MLCSFSKHYVGNFAASKAILSAYACKEGGVETDTCAHLDASSQCEAVGAPSPTWRFQPARGSPPVPDAEEDADAAELPSVIPEVDTSSQRSFDESFAR